MLPNKITLDAVSLAKLKDAPDGTEICDASGHTLTVVVSPASYREFLHARAAANFDRNRAQQAEEDYRSGRFKSTQEVLDLFEKLDTAAGS